MGNLDLFFFPTATALAQAAATRWLDSLETFKGTRYTVALSGGRIAGRFFSAIADLARHRHARLGFLHFFWGDERCVPPTDPESNFGLARDCLFRPFGIADNQIHRVRGEDPPEVAAAEAEAELRRFAPLGPQGQPVLDMTFLGMGEDGHVASLFPGEPEESTANPAVYRPVVAPKPPPRRITLGYPAIAAARQVWVLASGPGKENALHESLAPGGRTPLARVLRLRQHTALFTDVALEQISVRKTGSST